MAGRRVPGMVYAGSGLQAVSSFRGPEPALLDPRCKASWQADREGQRMPYWPFYSAIDPWCRGAYLNWLAGGRGPGAALGYVFLFFYGIERRILVDAAKSMHARAEIDGLLAEVERLLGLYGNSRSFRRYAGSFLAAAGLAHRPFKVADLRPPTERTGMDLPLTLRVALGSFAAEGKPIPPEWALSWVIASPGIRLTSPAQRCREEFRELFTLRYAEAFQGAGLTVQPGRTRIVAQYTPASPSFFGSVPIAVGDYPEVAWLPAPLRALQEITDGVLGDLDVYSRWLGRTGESRSPAGVSLLPPVLKRVRESQEVRRFVRWIEAELGGEGPAVVQGKDLLSHWTWSRKKLNKQDVQSLVRFLGQRGYGLEPDVRFGGPPPSFGRRPAVLFRQPSEDPTAEKPGPAYHAAAVLLHLAVALVAVDGEVAARQERHLLSHLEGAVHLSAAERARLKAHLCWLLAEPPGQAGLKKRIAPLPAGERRAIGWFLITVAGADGHVGAEELKRLTRIYRLLGLEPGSVYSDVHALASAEAPAAEPVTVRPAAPVHGFPIPQRPAPAEGVARGFSLDARKVQAKLAETEQVSSLLEGIFREEEAAPRAIPGLDAAHSAFLRRLAGQGVWPRADVEGLAGELGLLPDGALEVLNEAAYELCGAPLFEGDEMIEIDRQVLEEMTG